MKVMVIGIRGLPNVQGGVETHAEHIYPILVELGCEVDVIVRAPYQSKMIGDEWHGIHIYRLWTPRSKHLEVIIHTLLSVLYAGFIRRPDVLHIHAIGPSLLVPLARFLGLRVVVTHHGPDYDRQKWGVFAKMILRLGERFGMCLSHGRIVISKVICELVRSKYSCESTIIPNGVVLPEIPKTTRTLEEFGLDPRKYVLLVSRLVPEKRHFDLISAFRHAELLGWKLVIVGASDHPDAYTREILNLASTMQNVVCTGFQSGLPLRELYAYAGIFVLPSSHEGLPIAILEALSYGLPVIASSIPSNLEIGLPDEHYFPLGDVSALAARLNEFSTKLFTDSILESRQTWVSARFNWVDVAHRTLAIYQEVLLTSHVRNLD